MTLNYYRRFSQLRNQSSLKRLYHPFACDSRWYLKWFAFLKICFCLFSPIVLNHAIVSALTGQFPCRIDVATILGIERNRIWCTIGETNTLSTTVRLQYCLGPAWWWKRIYRPDVSQQYCTCGSKPQLILCICFCIFRA